MNQTTIFKKIGEIINEVAGQYQFLAQNPESINPLELELLIANTHFLSEHLAILRKLDQSPELLNERNPVPLISDSKVDELCQLSSNDKFDPASSPEDFHKSADFYPELILSNKEELRFEIITPEQESNVSPVDLVEEIPRNVEFNGFNDEDHSENENLKSAENLDEEPPVKPIILGTSPGAEEKIDSNQASREKTPTLNEILSASLKKNETVASLKQSEERDLKSMIKLNEKLMFVRDLFSGYSLAYSEAIELVNRFEDFESADNFLQQNYAGKNRWAEKQSTVDQFYEVLNRRFA